jgi:TPR repeat protein
MYQYGDGVEKDESRALKWFLNAAEQGDKKAQLNVGLMYQRGQGVSMDEVLGAKWLQHAAEQEVDDAQFQMGGDL